MPHLSTMKASNQLLVIHVLLRPFETVSSSALLLVNGSTFSSAFLPFVNYNQVSVYRRGLSKVKVFLKLLTESRPEASNCEILQNFSLLDQFLDWYLVLTNAVSTYLLKTKGSSLSFILGRFRLLILTF